MLWQHIKMKSILSIPDYRKKSCIEKSLLVCKWFNLKILYPVSHNLAHHLQLLTSSLWQCSHLLFRRILGNGSFMWLIQLQENAIQRTSSLNLICLGIPEVYHLTPQQSLSTCCMVNASKPTIWISIYSCRLFFSITRSISVKGYVWHNTLKTFSVKNFNKNSNFGWRKNKRQVQILHKTKVWNDRT